MDDRPDPGKTAVELEMGIGVGRGAETAFDDISVHIDDDHVIRLHSRVGHARRLYADGAALPVDL